MNTDKFRLRIGIVLIVTNFTVVLLMCFFRMIDWYDEETLKLSLAIIIPIFASYTTLIFKYYTDRNFRESRSTEKVNVGLIYISNIVICFFIIFLLALIVKQGIKPSAKDSYTFLLSLIETVFGIYLGMIVKSLFQTNSQD